MELILAGTNGNACSRTSEKAAIWWRPGFYGATELELISDKAVLEFQREYILGKEPVRMDLLIIKKLADVRIENEIGRIFKRESAFLSAGKPTKMVSKHFNR